MIKGSIQMAKKPYFFIVSLGTLIEYYDYEECEMEQDADDEHEL